MACATRVVRNRCRFRVVACTQPDHHGSVLRQEAITGGRHQCLWWQCRHHTLTTLPAHDHRVVRLQRCHAAVRRCSSAYDTRRHAAAAAIFLRIEAPHQGNSGRPPTREHDNVRLPSLKPHRTYAIGYSSSCSFIVYVLLESFFWIHFTSVSARWRLYIDGHRLRSTTTNGHRFTWSQRSVFPDGHWAGLGRHRISLET